MFSDVAGGVKPSKFSYGAGAAFDHLVGLPTSAFIAKCDPEHDVSQTASGK